MSDETRLASEGGFKHTLFAFASADPRSLGLFRIALGALLFLDTARRYPDIEAHYANTGWLPNHFALFRPMSEHLFSLYLTCSSPGQVKALLALNLLVDLCLLVGLHTRVMHVLAAVLLVSLNSRNIMLENGGWVVLTLLTVWTMFLPLGRRFSVDAFRRSLGLKREASLAELNQPLARDTEPVLSFAVLALVLQWAVIYGFNFSQKTGAPWHDGTAVYYALRQHSMLTSLGAWLANSLSLGAMRALTFGALAIEGAVTVLLLFPTRVHVTRMVAGLLVCVLHLSIASVLHLGTFSWSMVILFIALIPAQAWSALRARLSARRPARVLEVNGENLLALALCRIVKRFDLLEKIQYRVEEGEAAKRFTVVDPANARRAHGLKALDLLADALPLRRVTVAWTHIPGVAGLVKKWLRRFERKPEQYAAYFELEPETASEPGADSPARAFFAKLWSRLGEAVVLVLLVCCASQVLIENPAVPARYKPMSRPAWMTAVIVYPRLFQGWSMFAPAPPLEDVAIVVEGRTKDGRHFDPLTGSAPSFDVAGRSAHSRNCEWYYFERRLSEDRFKPYLGGVRDFLKNHHEITGRPQDQLTAFDVWSVSEPITLPGAPKAPQSKTKLVSFGVVRD